MASTTFCLKNDGNLPLDPSTCDVLGVAAAIATVINDFHGDG